MKLVFTLLLVISGIITSAQCTYSDPNIPKPATGYGADGIHTDVDTVSFTDPYFPTEDIIIYHPADIDTPVPTIFYSHAFGGNNPISVCGLINFVVSKGYALVFVPYQTVGVTVPQRYTNLLNGFILAAHNHPEIIDTTRTGFVGWSFGGGANYATCDTLFSHFNWGIHGRFIYSLAPWYSANISQAKLQSYPANTNLLIEVFDNDSTNDHRMAIDIFNTISIPDSQKNFLLLRTDSLNGYAYGSGHNVPNTIGGFDAYDYYAYYRLLDAMCDYTFWGSAAGKKVALGNGSAEQVTMPGGLKPLEYYTHPQVVYPESKYTYPCSNANQNPRIAYCPQVVATDIADINTEEWQVYPNPATDNIMLRVPSGVTDCVFTISSLSGALLLQNVLHQAAQEFSLSLSPLPAGIYIIKATDGTHTWNKKLVVVK